MDKVFSFEIRMKFPKQIKRWERTPANAHWMLRNRPISPLSNNEVNELVAVAKITKVNKERLIMFTDTDRMEYLFEQVFEDTKQRTREEKLEAIRRTVDHAMRVKQAVEKKKV